MGAEGFALGQVERNANDAWIAAIGMDAIPDCAPSSGCNSWSAADYTVKAPRVVTAIDGNTMTVDMPLTQAITTEFGGGSVFKYSAPGRCVVQGSNSGHQLLVTTR